LISKVKHNYFSWLAVALLFAGLIFIPLLFVLEGFLHGNNSNVEHIQEYLLWDMFFTTIRMIIGVGCVAAILGVSSAYFVSNFQFPLRRFLQKANILPIAIPTYIMGFTYASIFSVTGSFYTIAELFVDRQTLYTWNIDVVTEFGLMIFLGFALYPYVYSAALVSFSIKNKSIEEAAASLGVKPWSRFWRVSFPIVLPAIFSGLALVAMEVLNDYGAMSYFNINTITAGIFQAKQMDFTSSVYLSALFFVVIVGFFLAFYLIKSYRKVGETLSNPSYDLISVNRQKGVIISLVVFFPFFLGFIVPVAELLYLAFSRIEVIFASSFLITVLNSAQLALIPSVIIVLISFFLLYNEYLNKGFFARFISAVSNIGYAIPGAIIAVAVMAFVISFDSVDKGFYHFLMDTLVLLVFTYVIRFMAVGYNTLEAGFHKITTALPDSSRSMGKGSWTTFGTVYLPLMKTALFTTLAVVIVDVLKELPITLLLQPFNFKTLATVAYEKAKVSESVRDAAPYALLLIIVGTFAVLLLAKDSSKKQR